MMPPDDDISFEDFVTYVFDHGVTTPEWYWSDDIRHWNGRQPLVAEYLARLWQNPTILFPRFTADQIGMGLDFLTNPSLSNYGSALTSPEVSFEQRFRTITSLEDLYSKCFAKLLPNEYEREEDRVPEADRLNSYCFMFWEVAPLCAWSKVFDNREAPHEDELIEDACITVMERALAMRHSECQSSALLGLNLWSYHYPKRIERILQAYLSQDDLLAELREWAASVADRG